MKLRNKLILSCAALAAVATTAVSTTFAWYTSNDEVTASNISGASANSGSELLLISADAHKWGTSIEDVIENPNTELTPLAYVANSTPTGTDKTSNVLVGMTTNASTKKVETKTAAADASGYLGFTVYLKNASTTAKALNMNIVSLTNTSTALPAKSIIGNTAQFVGLKSSETEYTVNALRVLAMDLEVYKTTDGTNFTFVSEAAYDFENITTASIFDVTKVNGSTANDSLNGKTAGEITPVTTTYDDGTVLEANTSLDGDTKYYTKSGDVYTEASGKADGTTKYYTRLTDEEKYDAGSNFNAHQYYNAIMGPDSVIETPTADPTVFNAGLSETGKIANFVSAANLGTAGTSSTANTYIKVVGKIFLNGWDLACFDACQGQNFNLNISFDVKDNTNNG